jgi:hypothetical protein
MDARHETLQSAPKTHTGPLRMALVVIGLLLVVGYSTISVAAQDPLWFVKSFGTSPARIVVYHHDGIRTELRPGQPGFEELDEAIQATLAEGVERPSGIGFSDASLLDAYSRFVTVEAFFDQPVKLHAWFDTGEPTQMLFPISGRHSELSLVLLGKSGNYMSSPPVLRTLEPIRETLRSLGYY